MSMWHFDLMVPTFVHAHTCGGHRNHLCESMSCILGHALELVLFQDQKCAMQVRGIDTGLVFIVACRRNERTGAPKMMPYGGKF